FALRNRLRKTCCSFCSMPSTATGCSLSSRRTVTRCSWNGCSSSDSTSAMTVLTSTALTSGVAVLPGRDRLSRPLTILAARNVCRSIFSSTFVLGVGAFEQHLRETGDARQRRVHFVRDARRQQADRRHLLGNLQLLFELHA